MSERPMTQLDCQRAMRAQTRWILSAVTIFVTAFISMVFWCLVRAQAVEQKTEDLRAAVSAHHARGEEYERHISATLEEIKEGIRELRKRHLEHDNCQAVSPAAIPANANLMR